MTAKSLSLGLRVLRGVELNVLSQVAVLAVTIVVTPVIVRSLGPDGYALYTLLWTLSGYLIALNLGTGTAAQRFVAEHHGRGQSGALAGLLRRVLAANLAGAALGGVALLAARGFIAAHVLDMKGAALAAGPRVMACAAATAPAFFVLNLALNVLLGLQRFEAANALTALQGLGVAVAAAALLKLGYGGREVAAAFFFVHAALAAASLWTVRGSFLGGGKPSQETSREFVDFSRKTWLSQVLWSVTFQGDRLFIGSLLPLAQLGYYTVASTLAQKFNQLCGGVTSAAFPMFAELHGREEEARLKRLYLKASELSLFFTLLVSILSFVCIPQFVGMWLGGDFAAASTWPFRFLVIANLAYLTIYLPSAAAQARGAPHLFGVVSGVKAAALLLLWPWLIPRWGISGAAAGQAAVEALISLPFVWYVHRNIVGVRWREFLAEACYRPFVAGMGIGALALAMHARLTNWVELLVFAAAGSALYLGLGWWTLDREAKELAKQWVEGKLKLSPATETTGGV